MKELGAGDRTYQKGKQQDELLDRCDQLTRPADRPRLSKGDAFSYQSPSRPSHEPNVAY